MNPIETLFTAIRHCYNNVLYPGRDNDALYSLQI